MVESKFGKVLGQICNLIDSRAASKLSDRQLLEMFIARRDAGAFEALLRRYGRLVLSICRRRLARTEDIEDAFQATFVVLVRKATAIRQSELLGSWLYGVAQRIARRASYYQRRLQDRQKPFAEPTGADSPKEPAENELGVVIEEEVQCLPEKYRIPFLLCYLQGKTQEEAAHILDWPLGTVATRLNRARERLRNRLVRRGLTVPAAVLVAGLVPEGLAAVPPALAIATCHAALDCGKLSSAVALLVDWALRHMAVAKLKWLAAGLLVVGIFGAGVSLLVSGGVRPRPPEAEPRRAAAKIAPGPRLVWREKIAFNLWPSRGFVQAIALAPDGKTLAAMGVPEGIPGGRDDLLTALGVNLWNVQSGKKAGSLRGTADLMVPPSVSAFAFAPDSKTLVTAEDKLVVWDVASGNMRASFEDTTIRCLLQFSPDGKVLAAPSADGTICLLELGSGKVCDLQGHESALPALVFSDDGATVVSCGREGTVKKWDVSSGKLMTNHPLPVLARANLNVRSLALASHGKTLATSQAGDNDILVWDIASGKAIARRAGACRPTAIAFAPDGTALAVAGVDGSLMLWDVKSAQDRVHFPGHSAEVSALAFRPDGRGLASADRNGLVKISILEKAPD